MNAERLLAHYETVADAPDAIARLRRFVLDLAVRGKLVPQDPEDEPASELLKRIAKEKARLVKAGEIRKPKDSSGPECLELALATPAGWTVAALERLSPRSLTDGDWIETKDQSKDGGVRLIQLADVGVGAFLNKSDRYITEETEIRLNCTRLAAGDVLIARLPNPIGRACIFPDLGLPAITAVDVAILRPDSNVLGEFLVLAMNAPPIREQIEAYGKGATRFRVSTGHLKTVQIPLPPLAEQHRMVAKVEELMALCDRLEAARAGREATRDRLAAASLARLNAPDPETFPADARFALDALPALTTRADQIKALRQTILNLAVRGKLVPQDPEDEPASELLKRIANEKARLGLRMVDSAAVKNVEIPKGWAATTIGSYATDVFTGPFGSMLHQSDYVDGGVPLINPSHMKDNRIEHDPKVSVDAPTAKRMSSYALTVGDIVMARRGEVGRAALVEPIQNGWLCGTGSFFLRFLDEVNRHFLLLLFRTSELRAYLAGNAVGTTMVNLNHSILKRAPLLVPPLAEQRRIVAKVDELMALCDRLEASLTATAATRCRLLDALLAEALAPADARELEAAE